VVKPGLKTNEIGFVITAPNGTVVAQRVGAKEIFPPGIIMASFCPDGGCPTSPYITVNIGLTDSFGDGWNGNAMKYHGTQAKQYHSSLSRIGFHNWKFFWTISSHPSKKCGRHNLCK
jgi:hypothetical protein